MSDRPLRILHLTAGSDAGGLSRYVYDLCSAMTAGGHDVAVAGERGAWHWLFEAAPFPWVDAPLKGGPVALVSAARHLSRWAVARGGIDLLHVHYRRPALVARLVQRRLPVPVLYTLHLSDLNLRWPRRLLTDFGDHAHAASTEGRQWLLDVAGVPAGRVTLIPHGVDPARFPVTDEPTRRASKATMGIDPDAVVAACVGRLDDPKNEGWTLDVAAAVPGLTVLLAGEGPHETALRKRVGAEGLGGRVRLLGHRSPLPVYRAADALLLPSGREGFSLVCAEAMATGLPVLRTDTAGAAELIVDGVTGRAVPVDRAAFVTAAAAFLSDRDGLRRMGVAAAAHVRRRLTFDRQVRETVALYRRLCDRGSTGVPPSTPGLFAGGVTGGLGEPTPVDGRPAHLAPGEHAGG